MISLLIPLFHSEKHTVFEPYVLADAEIILHHTQSHKKKEGRFK